MPVLSPRAWVACSPSTCRATNPTALLPTLTRHHCPVDLYSCPTPVPARRARRPRAHRLDRHQSLNPLLLHRSGKVTWACSTLDTWARTALLPRATVPCLEECGPWFLIQAPSTRLVGRQLRARATSQQVHCSVVRQSVCCRPWLSRQRHRWATHHPRVQCCLVRPPRWAWTARASDALQSTRVAQACILVPPTRGAALAFTAVWAPTWATRSLQDRSRLHLEQLRPTQAQVGSCQASPLLQPWSTADSVDPHQGGVVACTTIDEGRGRAQRRVAPV